MEKSSIFFSPNTSVDDKVNIFNTLNINTEAISDKYLGLPAIVAVDRSFCEVMMNNERKCIGMLGGNYAFPRRKEVWCSSISTLLILPCLRNKFGDKKMSQILFVPNF